MSQYLLSPEEIREFLYRFLTGKGLAGHPTSDLTQETFLRLCKSAASAAEIRSGTLTRSLAVDVANKTFRDAIRGSKAKKRNISDGERDDESLLEDERFRMSVELVADLTLARSQLAKKLPDEADRDLYQEVIEGKMRGNSLREIASLLGERLGLDVTPAKVEKTWDHCRTFLIYWLKTNGYEDFFRAK